jgi:hypothetical protein
VAAADSALEGIADAVAIANAATTMTVVVVVSIAVSSFCHHHLSHERCQLPELPNNWSRYILVSALFELYNVGTNIIQTHQDSKEPGEV